MSTDLTFFTNEEGRTLLDRFKITLANNTKFFDVLVGYFRTSGFFHLYRSLEKVEKIRILVGINVNKQTHDLLIEAKEQQLAFLGAAFDYLRSACEALIEEVLFAGTIQRYDDHIKVQNLEEVIFDQPSALKIVDLHGRMSELILAHNRSDLQRENQPTLADLTAFRKEFEDLEKELKESRKTARDDRGARKDEKATARAGW